MSATHPNQNRNLELEIHVCGTDGKTQPFKPPPLPLGICIIALDFKKEDKNQTQASFYGMWICLLLKQIFTLYNFMCVYHNLM